MVDVVPPQTFPLGSVLIDLLLTYTHTHTQVQEEDILLVKGPTGAPERKPFDTRRESTEREWCLVSHPCVCVKSWLAKQLACVCDTRV